MDLASLGALPRYTCGQLYYYPAFHPRRDQVRCAPGCGPCVPCLPSLCSYHSCHIVQHHLAVKAGMGMANGPGCLESGLPRPTYDNKDLEGAGQMEVGEGFFACEQGTQFMSCSCMGGR